MDLSKYNRKKENIILKLNNMQSGVTWLPYYKYQAKLSQYLKQYKKPSTIQMTTNIKKNTDLALISLCVDKIIEDYLHSKQFHFHNIAVLPNPFIHAPNTAILLMYTKEPTIIEYDVRTHRQAKPIYKDSSCSKQYHRLSICGLTNGKNYISLRMYHSDHSLLEERTIHIYIKHTAMEENPITQTEHFAPSSYPHILITGGGSNPFIFNTNGDVLHFLDIKTSSYGILPLPNGRFLWPYRFAGVPTFANPHTCLLYEMDFMGRIYRTLHVKKGLHHYACILPNDNIVSISNSLEGHTEDTLVEIERHTGNIVRTIHVKELLGEHLMNQVDWAHPNTLEYNAKEDSMLICFRNVHAIVKFNWSTLEIQWILSPPELWKDTQLEKKLLSPIGNFQYSFQAHAAHEIQEFHIPSNDYRFYLIFDNHLIRRRPVADYTGAGYSYINIYGVNEKTMEVRQFKNMKIDQSKIRSNAIYDTKNNHIFNMSGCLNKSIVTDYNGKIEEFDYDSHHLLNRWCIKENFFSAHPFTWNSDDYRQPISTDINYRYSCGEADELLPVAKPWPEECNEFCRKRFFSHPYIEENYLYFHTMDHSVSSLIFRGTNHCYQRDYSDTWQTNPVHETRKYYCIVSLEALPPDDYIIWVVHDGITYKTKKYIKIEENKSTLHD